MPGAITSVTATTTANTTITATVYGAVIQVTENIGSTAYPQAFNVYHVSSAGTATSTGRGVGAGSSYTFSKTINAPQVFFPGDIVGFIKPLTATSTFFVDELGS